METPIDEAIIIAGGFGTRLERAIGDMPKPMAPIDGRPFLDFLIRQIARGGITTAVLAVGYKSWVIENYFSKNPPKNILLKYSFEAEPLGTGGAAKKALRKTSRDSVLLTNGDTFFDVDFQGLFRQHGAFDADVTLSLKRMPDCGRYGIVDIGEDRRITGFREGSEGVGGFIDGGVRILKRHLLDEMPRSFSIERDFLSVRFHDLKMFGYPSDGYFIDIGIPEDYEKAKKELTEESTIYSTDNTGL